MEISVKISVDGDNCGDCLFRNINKCNLFNTLIAQFYGTSGDYERCDRCLKLGEGE